MAKRSLYRSSSSPCRLEVQVWGVVFAVLWRYLVLIKFLPGEWERRARWDETLPAQSGIYGNQFCCSRFSQALWSMEEKHSTCVSMWAWVCVQLCLCGWLFFKKKKQNKQQAHLLFLKKWHTKMFTLVSRIFFPMVNTFGYIRSFQFVASPCRAKGHVG